MTRLFFIAGRLPYPMEMGPDFRTWMIIAAAAELGPVGVFGVAHRPAEVSPDARIGSWSTASQQTAIVHNARGLDDGSWVKDPDWRPSAWYHHPAVAVELEEAMAAFEPDVVILEQLGLAGYLPLARSHAEVVILNNHNVETDLQRQLEEAESSPVARMVRRQFTIRTELLERETLAQVDQVWVCSDTDRDLLSGLFGVPSQVVPNAIPVGDYDDAFGARSEQAAEGPRLVFPAQFAYLPNENAARFLLLDVLPAVLVRQPRATLALPGRDPGLRITGSVGGLPVTIPGAVASMEPYLRDADVMLIPLREGSGTRLKALEAFASGLPVISTAKGVEGLGVQPDVHYLAAETADEFAFATLQLSEPGVGMALRAAARAFVEERHSLRAVSKAVSVALAAASVRPS